MWLSFLTRYAWNTEASAPQRGAFIQAELLCEEIPFPPGLLLTFDGWGEEMNARDYWHEEVGDPFFWGCHRYITPLGLGFEEFDAIGQYREEDGGRPIDTRTEFLNDQIGSFEAPHPSIVIDYLSRYPVAQMCMVQKWFEYLMGSYSFAPTIDAAGEEQLREAVMCSLDPTSEPPDLDFKRLVAYLVVSDLFQDSFSCGEGRCSAQHEICLLGDESYLSGTCINKPQEGCPIVEPPCTCIDGGGEVTLRCAEE